MTQYQSWEGTITKAYERLGLKGGYARRVNMHLPSSLANSEYVVSDDVGLKVVARSGHKIDPVRDVSRNMSPHYHHYYGTEKSASVEYNRLKSSYQKRLLRLKKQMRGG